MSELNITGEDLLAWNDVTARKWRDFVILHPLLLTAPCDIREAATAGSTLLHNDVRADNVLITADKVVFVDWPAACTGAPWFE